MVVSRPSFTEPNEVFWEHQWRKHSTCSEHNLDKHELTSDLKDQVDVLKVVNEAGIIPKYSKRYTYTRVIDAIRNHMKVQPEIKCNAYDRFIDCCFDCPQSNDRAVNLCTNSLIEFPVW